MYIVYTHQHGSWCNVSDVNSTAVILRMSSLNVATRNSDKTSQA